MALTSLQRRIMAHLAANRSETSYVAGGAVLNKDWPRLSDDINIFHDTDEQIAEAAHRDLAALRDVGFQVRVEVDVYGLVEAAVSELGETTQLQWMSESRRRFLPLLRDDEWGARLAPADLAVNKVLAASTRKKARDFVDLASIGERLCPLGPLALAASGKPPHFSPQRTLEEMLRNCRSIWDDEFLAVKGRPDRWSPDEIRRRVATLVEAADAYVAAAPDALVGKLAIARGGVPVEVMDVHDDGFQIRSPTEEPEVIPEFKDVAPSLSGPGRL